METITLDKKKYVILEKKEYEKLQSLADANVNPKKKYYTIEEAKKMSYKQIEKWAKEK